MHHAEDEDRDKFVLETIPPELYFMMIHGMLLLTQHCAFQTDPRMLQVRIVWRWRVSYGQTIYRLRP